MEVCTTYSIPVGVGVPRMANESSTMSNKGLHVLKQRVPASNEEPSQKRQRFLCHANIVVFITTVNIVLTSIIVTIAALVVTTGVVVVAMIVTTPSIVVSAIIITTAIYSNTSIIVMATILVNVTIIVLASVAKLWPRPDKGRFRILTCMEGGL